MKSKINSQLWLERLPRLSWQFALPDATSPFPWRYTGDQGQFLSQDWSVLFQYNRLSGTLQALREKEKGDWKKMSVHEKKALYRSSFCQTFAEFQAPTGDWKLCIAGIFVASSLALLVTIWMNVCSKCSISTVWRGFLDFNVQIFPLL